MSIRQNMRKIRENANPAAFVRNKDILKETVKNIIETKYDDKKQMIEEVEIAFKDVVMVMTTKEFNRINKN